MSMKYLATLCMLGVLAGCGGGEPTSTGTAAPAEASAREAAIAQALSDPEFERACAEIEGCRDAPRFAATGARETIWRVQVIRQASGDIRFGRIEAIDVVEGNGVPVGPVAGSHRLVGLDAGGQPLDGQLLQFPEVIRAEYFPETPDPGDPGAAVVADTPAARWDEEQITGRPVDAIGFVRALGGIETLAVQTTEGDVVARTSIPAASAGVVSQVLDALVGDAHAAAGDIWPYEGNIPPYCAHIILLEGEMDRPLAQDIAYADQIVELTQPGPYQRASIFTALRHATPMLCQGIRRIATGRLPSKPNLLGAVRTVRTGDMMILNVVGSQAEERLRRSTYRQLEFISTVLHEAGHGVDALITAQGARPGDFAGDWIMPGRTMASETVERVRIEKGLRDEWERVHESFRRQGWASDYQSGEAAKEAVSGWSPQQITDGGFMSPYGATSVWDDIAEGVSYTYVSDAFRKRGWGPSLAKDYACQEMRDHGEKGLPSRFAAIYTKLMFLKDLGLIAEEDLAECIGDRVGLDLSDGGFHFWHDGNKVRSFDRNVTARMGTNSDGAWMFVMTGEGEASFDQEMYPAKLTLQLPVATPDTPEYLVPWPRGVYPLQLLGGPNVRVDLDGAPAGSFAVKDGFVLVAEASNDRIAGSIFITVAMRLWAPLPVPQTWRPPLIIRFLIER